MMPIEKMFIGIVTGDMFEREKRYGEICPQQKKALTASAIVK